MGFWIFMLIMSLLIPITMIGFGKLFTAKAPGEINATYGYRTSMSMKNKDTWEFAHRYFGKLWYHLGIVLLPITIISMIFVLGKDTDTVGWYGAALEFLQLVFLIYPIFPTEKALKKNFDENGKKR